MATAGLVDLLRARPPAARAVSGRTAGDLVAAVEAHAARLQGVAGEPVAVLGDNSAHWLVAVLALLSAGASPLLVAADAPDAEVGRLLELAGGSRRLTVDGSTLQLTDVPGIAGPGGRAGAEPGVLVPTSGSTGRPTIVARSQESLLREAERYRLACNLTPADRVVLPLPMSHAYGLAWAVAALHSGAELRPVAPRALTAIEDELQVGSPVLALVPTTARLLAARRLRRRAALATAPPRIAMIGAGPVDARLEADFRAAYGIGTSRNYGSTETGTLCAGLADLPPLCVGRPLSGVDIRVVDEDDAPVQPAGSGRLEVRLDGMDAWHQTGDLASVDVQGWITILGRRAGAIRRGGRWVAPLEVEAALRECPDIRDVRVLARAGRYDGEDSIVAEVHWAGDGTPRSDGACRAHLLAFARQRLAPHKVPDEIVLTGRLDRTQSGKVQAGPRYRLSGPAAAAAVRGYKAAEVLFALRDLGVLDQLDGRTDAATMAARLGLSGPELAWALDVAARLGLLTTESTEVIAPDSDPEPYLDLEARLSRSLVTRDAITTVLRTGQILPPPDDGLIDAYQRAMNGTPATGRTRLGLRLAGLPRGARILEVSAGPGRYLAAALAADPAATGDLVSIGQLAGPLDPALQGALAEGRIGAGGTPPTGAYHLVVVVNGVHGPYPGDDLPWLLDRLAPGGALLVDDVFLPADGGTGSELGLDWLTHGGRAWPTVPALVAGIAEAGGSVGRKVRIGSSLCHLVLAMEGS